MQFRSCLLREIFIYIIIVNVAPSLCGQLYDISDPFGADREMIWFPRKNVAF